MDARAGGPRRGRAGASRAGKTGILTPKPMKRPAKQATGWAGQAAPAFHVGHGKAVAGGGVVEKRGDEHEDLSRPGWRKGKLRAAPWRLTPPRR